MPSSTRSRLRTLTDPPAAHAPRASADVIPAGSPAPALAAQRAAPQPPYARVKQYLKDELEAGRWAPGAQAGFT